MPKKFLWPLHKATLGCNLLLQAGLVGSSLKAALNKFLSQEADLMVQPYGAVKNFDSLWRNRTAGQTGQSYTVARLDGHQNFSRINWYA